MRSAPSMLFAVASLTFELMRVFTTVEDWEVFPRAPPDLSLHPGAFLFEAVFRSPDRQSCTRPPSSANGSSRRLKAFMSIESPERRTLCSLSLSLSLSLFLRTSRSRTVIEFQSDPESIRHFQERMEKQNSKNKLDEIMIMC